MEKKCREEMSVSGIVVLNFKTENVRLSLFDYFILKLCLLLSVKFKKISMCVTTFFIICIFAHCLKRVGRVGGKGWIGGEG